MMTAGNEPFMQSKSTMRCGRTGGGKLLMGFCIRPQEEALIGCLLPWSCIPDALAIALLPSKVQRTSCQLCCAKQPNERNRVNACVGPFSETAAHSLPCRRAEIADIALSRQ